MVTEARLDEAVRLKLSLYPYLCHIWSSLIERCLRIIVRDRNDESFSIRISDLIPHDLHIHIWTECEDRRQTGDTLTFSGRLNELWLLAGSEQHQGASQHYKYLFHILQSLFNYLHSGYCSTAALLLSSLVGIGKR